MVDPLRALALAGAAFLLLALFVWPRRGLVSRWRRGQRDTWRVLIEDALKHLHNCEYMNISATLPSISGALSIPGDQATKLVSHLSSVGLLDSRTENLKLTEEGRTYALRIIRVHRLWERYLADETGLHETDWHPAAEYQEHRMSPGEADALAAQMGHPRFDPHGDPIPTSSGELPSRKGKPLSALNRGECAEIVHIEDEPTAIYAQIVAQSLYPGMRVQVIEASVERIRFVVEGEEIVLAPLFAANITVVPISNEKRTGPPRDTLSGIEPGEAAVVLDISKACRGQQRRRLLDLGVIPGTIIKAEMRSASGDPTAYRIRGATVALRKQQADLINIRPENLRAE